MPGEIGFGTRRIFETAVGGSWNIELSAQIFGEALRAFELGGSFGRAEIFDMGCAKGVAEPRDQRRFRPDDHKANGVAAAERNHRVVVRDIKRHAFGELCDAGVAGRGIASTLGVTPPNCCRITGASGKRFSASCVFWRASSISPGVGIRFDSSLSKKVPCASDRDAASSRASSAPTAAMAVAPAAPVIISADAATPHQSVITVMEAARRSGLSQITFATQSSAQAGAR